MDSQLDSAVFSFTFLGMQLSASLVSLLPQILGVEFMTLFLFLFLGFNSLVKACGFEGKNLVHSN